MRADTYAYYITDVAYNHLVTMAQRQQYVRFGSNKVKGLSNFLNDLAQYDFLDTRPDMIKEWHAEELRNNHAPTWVRFARRKRLLALTDAAISKYFLVAYQVGIIREEPYAIGGPSKSKPFPCVALVLEGIGTKWITPTGVPKHGSEY